MYCVYCGTANPDDALFCRSCGKQQTVEASTQEIDAINPPGSPFQSTLIEGGRAPIGDALIEGGNPSTFASPLEESFSHSVDNSVPPTSPAAESVSKPAPVRLSTHIRKYHNGRSRLPLVLVVVAVALVAVVVVSVFLSGALSQSGNTSTSGEISSPEQVAETLTPTIQATATPTPIKTVGLLYQADFSDSSFHGWQPLQAAPGEVNVANGALTIQSRADQTGLGSAQLDYQIPTDNYILEFYASTSELHVSIQNNTSDMVYWIFSDHATVSYEKDKNLSAPSVEVGSGSYPSTPSWHTFHIENKGDQFILMVDGQTVAQGSRQFVSDGSSESLTLSSNDLMMKSIKITGLQ